ncbi:MAG: hypothetical protein Q8O93_01115 [bacterium]|nr:hypothetical protein [bacterium]
MNKNIFKIRISLWLMLALIIAWFGYLKIVPSGNISYVYDFTGPSYFIGKLTPAERVQTADGQAIIKGDPVYFSLNPPRRFETAKVTVTFKNTTDFPVMELGLLNNKAAYNYDLKPLQNKVIDQLALAWPVVYGPGGSRLIQREKKYETIGQFLSDLPDKNEIAIYRYDLKEKYLLNDYSAGKEIKPLGYKFRGSYQFYTYIKNEELDYSFDFIDLNLNQDSDPIDIKVYSPDGLIKTEHLADQGENSRRAGIKIADLAEGVYRLSVIANDDIITNGIITAQSEFSLINRVWLASGNNKIPAVFTDSRIINAQTSNPASLQKIKAGAGELDLNETYRQISLKAVEPITELGIIKDDIIISGNGVFSFAEGGLLNPSFKTVGPNLGINEENINYVLTGYKPPVLSVEWQTAEAEFDLTKAYRENGKFQFLISLPGLKAEEAASGQAVVKNIKIELGGSSLWRKLKKMFNGLK